MNSDKHVLTIQLLDRKLQIKSPPEKSEELQKAAYYLDSKMREIRDSGSATGNERIALMAALNLSFELMSAQKQKDIYLDSINSRVRDLQDKVDDVLAPETEKMAV